MNLNKTFFIRYAVSVRTPEGITCIDGKEIIVKNQLNELFAKINLEKYLEQKYGSNFIKLEIKECFDDSFGLFAMMCQYRRS